VRQFGLQRHHRHITMTQHFHGIALLLHSAKSWTAFGPEFRDALSAAAAQATQAQWDFAARDELESRTQLEAGGIQIVDLDEAGRAKFRAAVRALVDRQYEALPANLAGLMRTAR
jgi:TRAP-type C4-dicarboxylate transport system substrate-binding protein